jgi:hypothetical protein
MLCSWQPHDACSTHADSMTVPAPSKVFDMYPGTRKLIVEFETWCNRRQGPCSHGITSKNYSVPMHCIEISRTNASESDTTCSHLGEAIVGPRSYCLLAEGDQLEDGPYTVMI